MMRIKNPSNSKDTWAEVTSVVPPSRGFPYWTLYPVQKSEEGYNRVLFIRKDELPTVEIQDDQEEKPIEEVNLTNGVRNNKMPDVLGEYRDVTAGGD